MKKYSYAFHFIKIPWRQKANCMAPKGEFYTSLSASSLRGWLDERKHTSVILYTNGTSHRAKIRP